MKITDMSRSSYQPRFRAIGSRLRWHGTRDNV